MLLNWDKSYNLILGVGVLGETRFKAQVEGSQEQADLFQ